ncbi:MAG: diguanylate cyclase [Giesbergeria sp.]
MPARFRLLRAPSRTAWARLAIGLALLAAALLLWALSNVYEERKAEHRHRAERELQTIGRLQAQAVGEWRTSHFSDAHALTDDSLFAQAVARWRNAPAEHSEAAAFVAERLRILQEHANYSAVSFVSPEGVILLADGHAGAAVPQAERKALAQALAQATASAVEPRRDPFFAFPFFSLMAPIFDGERALGAVWLVVDVRTSLFSLLSPWPTGSITAESVLVQAQGRDALLLSPLRRHADIVAHQTVHATETASPVVQAVAGARGLLYGRDDRGVEVMAMVHAIAQSPWLLVSKIDVAEAIGNAAQQELLVLSLPVSFVLLLAGLLLGGWQWAARKRESALKDKLAQNMQWLESAQKAALVGYYVYNGDSDTFTLSPMAAELFGLPSEAPVARTQWLAQVHPTDRADALAAWEEALSSRKALRMQYRLVDGDRDRWVDMWGDHNAPGARIHITGTVQDITERQLAEEKLGQYRAALETLVRQDPMTGVANRRALTETLVTEWQRAARTDATLSMLMIDVDHFKLFNDRYGHLAGDECLRKVAKALARSATRASDLVARYGGEEFAVLLPGTSRAEAVAIAEKLRLAVRKLSIVHAASGVAAVVTVSIGVATVRPGSRATTRLQALDKADASAGAEKESQRLIHQADLALYDAKARGRDRAVVEASEDVS